ncbi:4Fe-4S dicluster domain-containing protein, partial [Chloroflexota bacterium]
EAVIVDQEWCIGCGYCVQACPFDVPFKCEEEGTIKKCILCTDRTAQGLKPACVEACPAGAAIYGDRAEIIAEGERRVKTLIANGVTNANLYGDTESGGMGFMYVLTELPSVYGLPEAPQIATSKVYTKWLAGIVTAITIAIFPFWLLFRRKGIEDGRAIVEQDLETN